jgi:hypothetical protein
MRCGLRENVIERALVAEVKRRGGMALKFNSMGCNGVPDRLVLLPGSRIAFVEVKAPGEVMRPLQKRRKRQIEVLGFPVYCLDSLEGIEVILDEVQTS